MLNIDNVCKGYKNACFSKKKRVVLDHLSLTVLSGETVALIGESGCGKSTLIRLILGLDTPDSGRILWNGQEMRGRNSDKRALYKDVQPVFQDSAGCLNPRWRIRSILCEPLTNYFSLSASVEAKEYWSCSIWLSFP